MDKFHKIPIPKTEYHNELKQSNRNIPDLWLEDFTRMNFHRDTIELTGKQIFDYFADWSHRNNYKYDTNPFKLGVTLTNMKIDGITKGGHTRNGKMKIFDIEKLKKRYNMGCLIDF